MVQLLNQRSRSLRPRIAVVTNQTCRWTLSVVFVLFLQPQVFAQTTDIDQASTNERKPTTTIQDSTKRPSNRRPKVVKSDTQWRRQLTDLEYEVTRRKGTERAYSGKYWDSKKDGIYVCKCCGQPLFDSRQKYDSQTGWPSYFAPLRSDTISHKLDLSANMVRTEVICSRCDAHLGHVFDDGPQPTGLRYCMNSVSLRLVARSTLKRRQPQSGSSATKPDQASSRKQQ